MNKRTRLKRTTFLFLIGIITSLRVESADLSLAKSNCDPYKNYACLDKYLGQDFFTRFRRYYQLEWQHANAPQSPTALPNRRPGWPPTPQTTPPMPSTEWPYGGTTYLGVGLPNAVDSPFMVSISNTPSGRWLEEKHVQIYGWLNPGGNISSNHVKRYGNAPMAYFYTPNTVQLHQAVLYIERVPDTVQTTHFDWGFRLSGFYGTDYHYTTAYGFFSYQLLNQDAWYGYDFPMVYGEAYFPHVAQGFVLRFGRYIAIPDIEAQLAPNNYMYSHSMAYAFDNFTDQGILGSIALKENIILQLGITSGSDTTVWNIGKKRNNPFPNPLYPEASFLKDPGAQASAQACVRFTWNEGKQTFYPCMNGINNGIWGYNNLQWYGFTYYHKFDEHWHVAYELYNLYQNKVANINNPVAAAAIAAGGTPFSPQYMRFNGPNPADCRDPNVLSCRASAFATLAYINYQLSALDNVSFRPEFYNDRQGQRTGIKTRYLNFGLGWQHWFSPQIEVRPEIDYDYALDRNAFNGNRNTGIPPNKRYTFLGAVDLIVHF